MNLTITIQTPILVAGQQFKVEYSTDGSTWTFDGYHATNTFTTNYSGFTAGGTYYFRFTIVKSISPLVECDSVVRVITLPDEVDCLTITDVVIERVHFFPTFNYNLKISFTPPANAPCGGYVLKYGVAYPLTSISYSALPASPITLPVTNNPYFVEFYVLDCDGNETLCYQNVVSYEPPEEPCVPASLSSTTLSKSAGVSYLTFTIIPSTPATTAYTLNYTQINTNGNGIPDSGTATLPTNGSNPQIFTIQVAPNMAIRQGIVYYSGSITDDCGNSMSFNVSADL